MTMPEVTPLISARDNDELSAMSMTRSEGMIQNPALSTAMSSNGSEDGERQEKLNRINGFVKSEYDKLVNSYFFGLFFHFLY